MPSAITSFGANTMLDMIFGRHTEVPEQFYIALLTQPPGAQTTGELLSEPGAGTGYARMALVNSNTSWGEAAGGFTSTIADITFPTATADWPVITHYALTDGMFAGGVYLYGSFAVPRKILTGDKVTVPAGLLSLTLSSLTTAVVGAF